MDLFKFDLQRFADDGTTPTEDSIQDTTTADSTPEEQTEDQQQNYDFMLDEDGNLVFGDDEEEVDSEESEQSQKPESEPEKKEPEPPKYKVKISGEEKEVSIDELVANYQKGEDYTRKTQELAKQRAELEQAQRTPQQRQEPNVPTVKPKDLIAQLKDNAIIRAREVLELPPGEEFDEYNPMHYTAMTVELNKMQFEAVQQQNMQKQYVDLINEYRDKEGENFSDIDTYADYRLHNEMTRSESDKVLQAIQNGNMQVVRDFIEDTRKKWHGKDQGVEPVQQQSKQTASPPKVESPGIGTANQHTVKTRDMKDFRGKSMDSQVQKLIEWGLI